MRDCAAKRRRCLGAININMYPLRIISRFRKLINPILRNSDPLGNGHLSSQRRLQRLGAFKYFHCFYDYRASPHARELSGPDKPGRTSINVRMEGIRVTDLTGLTADRHVAACSQQGKRQNSKQFLHRFPHFQSKVEVSQRQRGGCHEQVCGLSILHRDSFIERQIPDITPTNIR
jgi:hypothetical protein